ncbi:MAG: hypothetical protein IJT94_04370 [Oscillibacter sp.]|nr:hypothetical protein [Oscillibacter sp.]
MCGGLRDEFDIPMTETVDEEVSLMCNLSEGVWLDGRQKGRLEGKQEGKQEGIKLGIEKSDLRNIQNLMDSTGWTMEKVMDMLAVPAEKRPAYAAKLRKQ